MNTDFQLLAQESATLLGIHITWILLLTLGTSRLIHHTILKRTLWRSTFIAMLLLLGSTFSGLYQWNWMTGVSLTAAEPASLWKPMQLVSDSNSIATPSIQPEAPVIQNRDTKEPSSSATTTTAFLLQSWFLGMAITSSLMMINALIWRIRMFRQASPASSNLRFLFKQAATSLNYRRTPQLIESPSIRSPLVMGCVRPVIAFPVDYADLYNTAEQQLIMSHEIAHLREKDGWWQCLANLVCMAAWWHPLVWIARQRLRQSAEETADNLSTRNTTHREQLATCLVRIGRELNTRRCPGALSIFGAGFRSQLGKRVERLIQHDPSWNKRPKGVLWISLRLATPLLLIGAMFSTASWFGTYSGSSASDSMRHSLVGLMLMAEEEEPPYKPSATVEARLASEIETRLKKTVIPNFKYDEENTYENLKNLRKAILSVEPTWENLTIHLRSPSLIGSFDTSQLEDKSRNPEGIKAELSTKVMGYIQFGPAKEIPNHIPPYRRMVKKSDFLGTPKGESIEKSHPQKINDLVNETAYDLLFKIMQPYQITNHHYFAKDMVIFDVGRMITAGYFSSQGNESQTSPSTSPQFEGPPAPITASPLSTAKAEPPEFYTRVYKTNPPTFLQRVMALSGSLNTSQSPGDSDIQKTVHKFISNLGIKNIPETPITKSLGTTHYDAPTLKEIKDDKALFYNDRNGNLFTRLTLEDHDKLEAALALLQDPAERNTKIAMNMHVVQLDEAGIKTLKEFGFDSTPQDSGQFEHTIDTSTLERLLLRMNLAPGVDILQSPRITALNGRQSELKAQELRRIVTTNETGTIQTEEIATGPSLSVIPKIQADGKLQITAHFELLEFLGYDDPGSFRIVTQNAHQENNGALSNKKPSFTGNYQAMLKEMDLAPKREIPNVILKYMPSQLKLKQLSKELETAQQTKAQLETKVSKNAKDTINTQRNLTAVKALIPAFQKQLDQEVASIRRHILAQMQIIDLSVDNVTPTESSIITASTSESAENTPVPLPRFNRLELNTYTSLQSGQTLIMGGLKSIETIKWKNNVPVMSKIPLLGGMFRREGTSKTEQYIYVLITPTILK